jgi:hypothetical protein
MPMPLWEHSSADVRVCHIGSLALELVVHLLGLVLHCYCTSLRRRHSAW